jgi:hypothetical protein
MRETDDRIGNTWKGGRFHFREISAEDAARFESLELAAPKVYHDPFKTGRDLYYAEPRELELWRNGAFFH